MAIFLGNTEPQWPSPVHPSTDAMFPHYGARQGKYLNTYLAGFSDDAATGMAIRLTYASANKLTNIAYLNKAGVVQWTKAVAQWTDVNEFGPIYMDDNDECLYVIVINTSTTPDEYKLTSVDKEGNVTQSFAWTEPSGTSFDFSNNTSAGGGSLYRTGGDGSGNFVTHLGKAVISTASGVTPITGRGVKMTFAASDGALTETVLLPDTAAGGGYFGGIWGLKMGPTSNNIIGNFYVAGGSSGAQYGVSEGPLINTSTGNGIDIAAWPSNMGSPFIYASAMREGEITRWRSHYAICNSYTASGGFFYTEASIHSMMDEMAVTYGIL